MGKELDGRVEERGSLDSSGAPRRARARGVRRSCGRPTPPALRPRSVSSTSSRWSRCSRRLPVGLPVPAQVGREHAETSARRPRPAGGNGVRALRLRAGTRRAEPSGSPHSWTCRRIGHPNGRCSPCSTTSTATCRRSNRCSPTRRPRGSTASSWAATTGRGAVGVETLERLSGSPATWIRGNGERWLREPPLDRPEVESYAIFAAGCPTSWSLALLPPPGRVDGVLYVHGSPLSDVESFSRRPGRGRAAAGRRPRPAGRVRAPPPPVPPGRAG